MKSSSVFNTESELARYLISIYTRNNNEDDLYTSAKSEAMISLLLKFRKDPTISPFDSKAKTGSYFYRSIENKAKDILKARASQKRGGSSSEIPIDVEGFAESLTSESIGSVFKDPSELANLLQMSNMLIQALELIEDSVSTKQNILYVYYKIASKSDCLYFSVARLSKKAKAGESRRIEMSDYKKLAQIMKHFCPELYSYMLAIDGNRATFAVSGEVSPSSLKAYNKLSNLEEIQIPSPTYAIKRELGEIVATIKVPVELGGKDIVVKYKVKQEINDENIFQILKEGKEVLRLEMDKKIENLKTKASRLFNKVLKGAV